MPQVPSDDKLVTVFSSRSHLAAVEAEVIYALLASAGIRAWLVRENVVQQPVGKVSIKVTAENEQDALQLIRYAPETAVGDVPPELANS